jgi:hypothetical protein
VVGHLDTEGGILLLRLLDDRQKSVVYRSLAFFYFHFYFYFYLEGIPADEVEARTDEAHSTMEIGSERSNTDTDAMRHDFITIALDCAPRISL